MEWPFLSLSGWVKVLGEDRLCGHIIVEFFFFFGMRMQILSAHQWQILCTHYLFRGSFPFFFHSLLQFRISKLWWCFTSCLYLIILGLLGKKQAAKMLMDFADVWTTRWRNILLLEPMLSYLDYLFRFIMLWKNVDISLCKIFNNKSFDLYSPQTTERHLKLLWWCLIMMMLTNF